MRRLLDSVLADHLKNQRQMAFVCGPRQVGKTTTCRALGDAYFNWDASPHMRAIVEGPAAVARSAGLEILSARRRVVVFDELHKFPRWKAFLKGFFDLHEPECRVVVTGSSRLDAYRRGGDSLMGRYFLYRMHPFSARELADAAMPGESPVRAPVTIAEEAWEALWRFGGFPEPLLAASDRFHRRWLDLRRAQIFKEDVREMTRIHEFALAGVMGRLLEERSGEQLVIANLARDVGVAPNSARAWVEAFCALHVGFLVRPWSRNIASALRKEPKWFLRDWSGIADEGKRFETLIACHLLKAVEGWADLGLGRFDLRYVRDKQKREVDFLVVRDGQPWLLVEAKTAERSLSPALAHFQRATGAAHALQVVGNLAPVDADCFSRTAPTVVPARTFLSQLL
jgi:hypothetical protein